MSTNKRSSSSYFCLDMFCTLKYTCQGSPSWGITILLIPFLQLFCTKIDKFAAFVQNVTEIPLPYQLTPIEKPYLSTSYFLYIYVVYFITFA